MSSLFDAFDKLQQNFSFGEGKSDHPVGNLFTLLGNNDKYIAGTYNSLLKRPELFGKNAQTLLYALDVGQSFKKDALFLMFKSFLQHPPQTSESSIIFTWAEELRRDNEFIVFEPIFDKLNQVIKTWFVSKTINYEGRVIPLEMFRPLLYNSAGVNVIELLPYIAYIICYHVYGYPFQFSEALSSSSMRSYLSSLENWLATCYATLYKEQEISLLNSPGPNDANDANDKSIDDDTWIAFYNTALDSSKIIQLRDDEIRKTDGLLTGLINDQQAANEKDLADRYDEILYKLVKISIETSPFNSLYSKFKPFDASYYDSVELSNVTSYFVTSCAQTAIIDRNDKFRYMLYSSSSSSSSASASSLQSYCSELKFNRSDYDKKWKLKQLTTSLQKPFCSGDISLEMFKGYLRNNFENKRDFLLDDSPIYLNVSCLDDPIIYDFILKWFVNGVWALESSEMKILIQGLKSGTKTSAYMQDIFALRKTFEIIYGNTVAAILTPVYAISMINEWCLEHSETGQDFSEFNPFLYIKNTVPDEARVIKLQNLLYSVLFLNSYVYQEFVNSTITEFYEIMISEPIIIQPYIQAFDDSAPVYSLGGVDAYRFEKYSNPLTRGYGFLSRVGEMNEELYVTYRFGNEIKNETVLELIEDKSQFGGKDEDINSIIRTIVSASKKIDEPSLLFKYKYVYNEDGSIIYGKRAKGSYADLMLDGTSVVAILRDYSFVQALPRLALENETMRVKLLPVDGTGSISGSVKSTKNGFNWKDKFISMKLSGTGSTKYVPLYAPATGIVARNIAIMHPDGKKLIEIITPTTGVDENNNVFWIFTTRKKSAFERNGRNSVNLKASGYQPRDGTYMLTDRIQDVPLL